MYIEPTRADDLGQLETRDLFSLMGLSTRGASCRQKETLGTADQSSWSIDPDLMMLS